MVKRKRVVRKRGRGFGDFLSGSIAGLGSGLGKGVSGLLGGLFGGARRRKKVVGGKSHKPRKRVVGGKSHKPRKRVVRGKGLLGSILPFGSLLGLGRRRKRGGEGPNGEAIHEGSTADEKPRSLLGRLNSVLRDSQIISKGLREFGGDRTKWLGDVAHSVGYGKRLRKRGGMSYMPRSGGASQLRF